MTSKSKKRKATVKSPQNECVPYWTNITKDWSNQLLSCTKTDLKILDKTLWNSSLKNLASNSWFQVKVHQYEQHEHLKSSISLSSVIMEDVQDKITKEERADPTEKSNINKHTGRVTVRTIRMVRSF